MYVDWANHRDALHELIGTDSPLWQFSPEMALVLIGTVPSGDSKVVQLRTELAARLRLPRMGPHVPSVQQSYMLVGLLAKTLLAL